MYDFLTFPFLGKVFFCKNIPAGCFCMGLCRGEHCSPAAVCSSGRFPGRIWNPPLRFLLQIALRFSPCLPLGGRWPRRAGGREPCGRPKYFGQWQALSPTRCGGSPLPEGAKENVKPYGLISVKYHYNNPYYSTHFCVLRFLTNTTL